MTITSIKDKLFGTSSESLDPIEAALETIAPIVQEAPPEKIPQVVPVVSAPVSRPVPTLITAVKVFKVGDKEYSSKEEAIRAAAMEVLHSEIPKGIDNVIAKASDIIAALRAIKK